MCNNISFENRFTLRDPQIIQLICCLSSSMSFTNLLSQGMKGAIPVLSLADILLAVQVDH